MKKLLDSSGFSLLEVLIAFALMTGVLLGFIVLQNSALNQVYNSYQQSMAVSQAEAMMERLRSSQSSPERTQLFNDWLQELSYFLPQGKGDYQCFPSGQCTVNVYWEAHGLKNFNLMSII